MSYHLEYVDFYYKIDNYIKQILRSDQNFSRPVELINMCSLELRNVDENKVIVVFKGGLSTNVIHLIKTEIEKQSKLYNFQIVYGNIMGEF